MDTKKIAESLVKSVKAYFAEEKKKDNFKLADIDIEVWDCKRGNEITYTISNGWQGTIFKKIEGLKRSEVIDICNEFRKGLDALKATKGWGNLSYKETRCCDYGFSTITYVKFPTTITYMANPCKEFVSLVNYIKKYSNITINPLDLYGVRIGGKRGRVYGEEGNRRYLCHNPKKCEKYLEELRKSKGSADKMSVTFNQYDDIDSWELQVSIRNETEFSGYRYSSANVKLATPKGKEKFVLEVV